MNIPTIVIAGTHSGVGKTTVACAIAAALAKRGRTVRMFKCGPDYLDPTWHALVASGASRTLDEWMLGADGMRASFARAAIGADVAVVEGAMGLFDGVAPESLEGSTARHAALLGAPIALVIDASAMARSAAAIAEGFARHAPEARIAGVICNRAGSVRHAELLRRSIAQTRVDGLPLRWFGALTDEADLTRPSRHLGLRAATATEGLRDASGRARWRARLAAAAEAHLDLDALMSSAAPILAPCPSPAPHCPSRARIGIALDEAFHFYYQDNLDLLRAAGAELVEFSPIQDDRLPPALDGVYLGGGYPEAHARALSRNLTMLADIRAIARAGRPVYGECGGLMYLGQRLVDANDESHELCGLLPIATRMEAGLHGFGYREVEVRRDCSLGRVGTCFRGHEFHWSSFALTGDAEACFHASWPGGSMEDGFRCGSVLGTYIHAHWGSNPRLAQHFVDACARHRTHGGG